MKCIIVIIIKRNTNGKANSDDGSGGFLETRAVRTADLTHVAIKS
jgi:hypothetical protein